jgi:hypothetical protein
VVTPSLVVLGFGVFTTTVGALGLAGKLIRLPSTTLTGNYGAHFLLGVAMLAIGFVSGVGQDSVLGTALSIPAIVLMGVGLYAFFVRSPRWIVPAWQREIDEAERRPRR